MLNYKPENGKTEKKDLWISRRGKLSFAQSGIRLP
jgi:hypothetical protein